ncbi:hypothetical protein BTN50_1821 [Candidatus Enterovibrio altilux]|uniref:Uncharacterized protein n=1 Tax=Candidatus Enterovibrio altilux TaxID=1927128 RepID=A0A291BB81_9GAMM|nr:hypothetical protein BTN50_1821 [Candidatus Enterovibrio luxaltus]
MASVCVFFDGYILANASYSLCEVGHQLTFAFSNVMKNV